MRDFTSCLCSAAAWAVCFEGSVAGVNATETGNEVSQPTLEFTSLNIMDGGGGRGAIEQTTHGPDGIALRVRGNWHSSVLARLSPRSLASSEFHNSSDKLYLAGF